MAQLDEKGRCCGRKPIVYKGQHSTPEGPQRYCPRCDRAYHLEENWQISNWAYWTDSLWSTTGLQSTRGACAWRVRTNDPLCCG